MLESGLKARRWLEEGRGARERPTKIRGGYHCGARVWVLIERGKG